MPLESYSELNFIGDEEKIIRMENEEITEEQEKNIKEGDPCKSIWPILQEFFADIPTYPVKKKLSGCANEKTAEAVIENDINIAEEKEKKRIIDFPFVCEKIIIGYLYNIIKKEEMQKAIKQKLIKDRLIKVEDNIKAEIQQASPYDDRIEGADAFLVVKKLNKDLNKDKEELEELIKAIPIQITTAIVQNVLLEKMQKTKENEGILITVNAGNIRLLVNKYLEYYNSFVKQEKEQKKEPEKEQKKEQKKEPEKDNSMKDEPKLAPWDYFEFQDIVRNDDLEKITKEGEEIKWQFFYGMKERL